MPEPLITVPLPGLDVDRVALARQNHRRMLCGPGVPGCDEDCDGDGSGHPEAWCAEDDRAWPCETAVLLSEIDRLGDALDRIVRDDPPTANEYESVSTSLQVVGSPAQIIAAATRRPRSVNSARADR